MSFFLLLLQKCLTKVTFVIRMLLMGRGFQKIRDRFEPAGIPMPKVENFCGGVRVTIQRTEFMQMMNVTSDVSSSVSSLSAVQLTDRQKKYQSWCKKILLFLHNKCQ